MRHWHLFTRLGREHVAFCFSYKGGKYFVYDCLQPVATHITQDTQPTICDAQLTLFSKMGHGGYRSVFCI